MAHAHEVQHVVTYERAVLGAYARGRQALTQRYELVVSPEHDVVHAQVCQAAPERGGGAARDHGQLHPFVAQQPESQAIVCVERLQHFALFAVEEPPVGQHAVDVHDQQPHPRGSRAQVFAVAPVARGAHDSRYGLDFTT